jgi:hypothetical protein
MTNFPRHYTAEVLTSLVQLPDSVISSDCDFWMPRGLTEYRETTLVDNSDFLTPDRRKALTDWWLEKLRGANLPNWDIASTCTIEKTKGLVLVEAKAHDKELSEAGKSLPTTTNGQMNHKRIGIAIEQANIGLNGVMKGWALSRDSHYQLSNRFAWAWKLTTLGMPVVLIYLGFLNAIEMCDQGQPFDNNSVWDSCIRNHAKNIVPDDAWGKRLDIDGTPVWFLIRSVQLEPKKVD